MMSPLLFINKEAREDLSLHEDITRVFLEDVLTA